MTVIEGDWNSVSGLGTYDGIFFDTYMDENYDNFKDFALAKIKSGGKITYWNNFEKGDNPYEFDSVSYEQVSVTPEDNYYTSIQSNYYMPKVEM